MGSFIKSSSPVIRASTGKVKDKNGVVSASAASLRTPLVVFVGHRRRSTDTGWVEEAIKAI